ncbi:hypothetical protein ATZ33_08275 [Enterococcus silesiacus]|uniref:Gram-positive cocci surface proteins LPxTG domain-containing protein n=1 Tax=Enterococcus silesiacus TaxID=332949 RepID=A0ABN4J622_9ENTE|nr:hypothetical protein [Enterococcus silesiacus]ALS01362.1 hypothetical protein ATZ33_08275 [Enterococcus silesiacus]
MLEKKSVHSLYIVFNAIILIVCLFGMCAKANAEERIVVESPAEIEFYENQKNDKDAVQQRKHVNVPTAQSSDRDRILPKTNEAVDYENKIKILGIMLLLGILIIKNKLRGEYHYNEKN